MIAELECSHDILSFSATVKGKRLPGIFIAWIGKDSQTLLHTVYFNRYVQDCGIINSDLFWLGVLFLLSMACGRYAKYISYASLT
jgi:hypothetical protein